MPGSPSIDQIIYDKIAAAALFVGDVTLVTAPNAGGRRAPNPNVLVELGYAAAKLGWERVVSVCNSGFGVPEELPFDLRQHRLAVYKLKGDTSEEEQGEAKGRLVVTFRDAIEAVLGMPALKDLLMRFLDETNPDIRLAIRSGASELKVEVSEMRLGRLVELSNRKGFDEVADLVVTQGTNIGPGTPPGICPDRTTTGVKRIVNIRFKGDLASW